MERGDSRRRAVRVIPISMSRAEDAAEWLLRHDEAVEFRLTTGQGG